MELGISMEYVLVRATQEAETFSDGDLQIEHLLLGIMKLPEIKGKDVLKDPSKSASFDAEASEVGRVVRENNWDAPAVRNLLRICLAGLKGLGGFDSSDDGSQIQYILGSAAYHAQTDKGSDVITAVDVLRAILRHPTPIISSVLEQGRRSDEKSSVVKKEHTDRIIDQPEQQSRELESGFRDYSPREYGRPEYRSQDYSMRDHKIPESRLVPLVGRIPFPAYRGDEPYIFVSYAHDNVDEVFYLIKQMYDQGYHLWYDEGIAPGNEWTEEIANALENADVFLVFLTPESERSPNVRDEINYALNENKPFLAIHLKETPLSGGLKLRMGRKQAILKYRMTDEEYRYKYIFAFDLLGLPVPSSIQKIRDQYYMNNQR